MNSINIDAILDSQRAFFRSGKTLSVSFRIEMLKKLHAAVKAHEQEINEALTKDLGKSAFEGFMCETGLALTEISYMIRHVRRFVRRHSVYTPIAQFASTSFVKPSPYGNTLIMSPWNYPFLLTIDPLADAIAAGNTAIVKPSAYSHHTSGLLAKLLGDIFPREYVAVITGGRKENASLLEKKFDFVFFTGSTNVGKEVLRHTAEHLTPAVLELGGKSPCIVDSSAKIPLAARRIAFGKFLNCGQTCVAPDYILCEKSIKNQLITQLRGQIIAQYGERPLENPDYGRIINEKHFDRICTLIDPGKVALGGQTDRAGLRIAPTLLDGVCWEDAVMQEEIFGPVLPVLPVLTYDRLEDVVELLGGKPRPLALYFFGEDRARANMILQRCQFGGGCINDCVIHLATSEMGFGGVGESGMGAYHGKTGFDTFSHKKSIVDKKTWMDLPMRYQPYKKRYDKLLHMILK